MMIECKECGMNADIRYPALFDWKLDINIPGQTQYSCPDCINSEANRETGQ